MAEETKVQGTEPAAEKAKTEAESRAAQLEAKVTAYSKGVKPEAVDDVIALAMAKVSDDVPIGKAIEAVIAKYPSFCGTSTDKPKGITAGTGSTTYENFPIKKNKDVNEIIDGFAVVTSDIKLFVMSELEKYYEVIEQQRKCSKSECSFCFFLLLIFAVDFPHCLW